MADVIVATYPGHQTTQAPAEQLLLTCRPSNPNTRIENCLSATVNQGHTLLNIHTPAGARIETRRAFSVSLISLASSQKRSFETLFSGPFLHAAAFRYPYLHLSLS